MKSPKVGERVAVYTPDGRYLATIHMVSHLLAVSFDLYPTPAEKVHPKQCRRLVSKERIRVWLHSCLDGSIVLPREQHPERSSKNCSACREFIEVRRK